MGKYQLDKITALKVKQFYNHLLTDNIRADGKKGPLSSRSVKDIHGLLHKMFSDACKWDLIDTNIMEKIDPPAVEKKEAVIYEEDKDIIDVIVALFSEPLQKRILFLTAMSASMRRGELVGLNFNHINFQKNEIKVCQSAAQTQNGPILALSFLVANNDSKIFNLCRLIRSLRLKYLEISSLIIALPLLRVSYMRPLF